MTDAKSKLIHHKINVRIYSSHIIHVSTIDTDSYVVISLIRTYGILHAQVMQNHLHKNLVILMMRSTRFSLNNAIANNIEDAPSPNISNGSKLKTSVTK